MKPKKFLAVHAHFYQPPRENPWTGEIEPQESAKPYDNWNHRIAMECYIPNLFGRINNYNGETLEMLNNYEYLNFNFGPTLLSWLELEYPDYYRMIIETARRVKEKKGFPNAIAQSYNHTILPLDNFQDRLTQIRWGIRDFESRFGFSPEGVWLPETAVNEDTLRLLIDNKVKYAILAPYQLKSASDLKTGEPLKLVDNKLNYRWFDRDTEGNKIPARSLALFVYDGELARKVAFENITFNSAGFAEAVNASYEGKKENPQLTIIATDGETYGHHHKFADMTLSHAFRHELSRKGVETVNLSEYLSLFPPQYEAELSPGPDGEGTSWSCAHGVRRWKGGCSCGDEGKYQTSWRLPLRSALNWLRTVLIDVYAEEGKGIFKDVWKARNEYIELIRDGSDQAFSAFLERNAPKPLSREEQEKALKLLLMQKYSMFMFTSCGWFFNDISRIEAQQNLKYASMAAEIAQSFGFKGIERAFISLLEMAASNFRDFEHGGKIYDTLVKPAAVPEKQIFAYNAIKDLTGLNRLCHKNQKYEFYIKDLKTSFAGECEVKSGLLETRDKALKRRSETLFAVLFKPDHLPEFYFLDESLKGFAPDAGEKLEPLKKCECVRVSDLPRFMQKALADRFICKVKYDNYGNLKKILNGYVALMENEKDIPVHVFENLTAEADIYLKQLLRIKMKELIFLKDEAAVRELNELLEISEKFKISPILHNAPDLAELMPEFVKVVYEGGFDENVLGELKPVFSKTGLSEFALHIENYLEAVKRFAKAN
ncbi:MAG: hypothetical protein COT17_06455 [Elusimicrobia bacterium CG08_land_8_20_14_0_20_51_18]|nr:MAG: hypothetical protein COT17_06455 [Elusimicrobia bacterium CG08_land_8_20_14_0_20_51_18]